MVGSEVKRYEIHRVFFYALSLSMVLPLVITAMHRFDVQPWWLYLDQDVLHIVGGLALNSGEIPAQAIHPGFFPRIIVALWLHILALFGLISSPSMELFSSSPEPMIKIKMLIEFGHYLSLFIGVIFCIACGLLVQKLINSKWGFPLGILISSILLGVLSQSIHLKTEIYSALFGSLGLFCCLKAIEKIHRPFAFHLFGIFCGGFWGLSLFSKIMGYPYLCCYALFAIALLQNKNPTVATALFTHSPKPIHKLFRNSYNVSLCLGLITFVLGWLYVVKVKSAPPHLFFVANICALSFLLAVALRIRFLRIGPLALLGKNFIIGFYVSQLIPFLFSLPFLGITNAYRYAKMVLWRIHRPFYTYNDYSTYEGTAQYFSVVTQFFNNYSFHFSILILFLVCVFYFPKNRSLKTAAAVSVLLFSVIISLRGIRPSYFIYTDLFIVILVSFFVVDLTKYCRARKAGFSLWKKLLHPFVGLIFLLALPLQQYQRYLETTATQTRHDPSVEIWMKVIGNSDYVHYFYNNMYLRMLQNHYDHKESRDKLIRYIDQELKRS